MFKSIAKALSVSVEYLITGNAAKKSPYHHFFKENALPGEDPYTDEQIAEMNARIKARVEPFNRLLKVVRRREELAEAARAHFELMDEAEDFKTIYDECLSDRGKRKLHEYLEDLIKNPDNIKGTLKVPDDSIQNDDEPDND